MKEGIFISLFLWFWISETYNKGVVTLSAWKEFVKYWDDALEDGEAKESFFNLIRGLLTPYRTKYADEAGLEVDIDKESMELDEKTIVNWHYSSVSYLISDKAVLLRDTQSQDMKISKKSILTPKEFYNKLEVDGNDEIVERFNQFRSE